MSSDDPVRASELLAAIEEAERSVHRDSPLNTAHVEKVFNCCLAHGDESHPTITVQGIMHTAHFSCDKLSAKSSEIAGMLGQLPIEFMPRDQGGGGGWSFLNACNDRDGVQWTGFHLVMEKLFLLGMGCGMARWCLPREMWEVLPGQMPYIEIDPQDSA
jgi:hypothetical protein